MRNISSSLGIENGIQTDTTKPHEHILLFPNKRPSASTKGHASNNSDVVVLFPCAERDSSTARDPCKLERHMLFSCP